MHGLWWCRSALLAHARPTMFYTLVIHKLRNWLAQFTAYLQFFSPNSETKYCYGSKFDMRSFSHTYPSSFERAFRRRLQSVRRVCRWSGTSAHLPPPSLRPNWPRCTLDWRGAEDIYQEVHSSSDTVQIKSSATVTDTVIHIINLVFHQ